MQVCWHSCPCAMECLSELLEYPIQNSALLFICNKREPRPSYTSVYVTRGTGLTCVVLLLAVAVARHQGYAGLPHLPSCHEAAADHGLYPADDNPLDALRTYCCPQRAHIWVCGGCTLLPSTSGGYNRPGDLSPHWPPVLFYNTRRVFLSCGQHRET